MLYQSIHEAGQRWGVQEAVCCGGRATRYDALAARAAALADALAHLAGRNVGLAISRIDEWIAVAAALDRLGSRCFLVPAATPICHLPELAEAHELSVVLSDEPAGREPSILTSLADLVSLGQAGGSRPAAGPPTTGQVVLFTSGTSNKPKAAMHTWASLASGIKRSDKLLGVRMLLTYDASRYAGLQMLLTALLNGARLTVPVSRQITDVVEAILGDEVEFVSGTPTFWRMLLANSSTAQQRAMRLRQITLGGEPIGQPVLNSLKGAFPQARITHIYASTEMGVCFSVHDGREGFPADFLESEQQAVRLKVQDGRLWIRSNRAMDGYIGGQPVRGQWFDTGDAVEVRGGRVHFLGRESGRINVGGEKVYPEQVEAVIRAVRGVAEVRVSGLSSSIVGQLVQAEIVPIPGVDPAELRVRILACCREQLAPYQQPRVIKFSENLVQADTMKVSRQAQANG